MKRTLLVAFAAALPLLPAAPTVAAAGGATTSIDFAATTCVGVPGRIAIRKTTATAQPTQIVVSAHGVPDRRWDGVVLWGDDADPDGVARTRIHPKSVDGRFRYTMTLDPAPTGEGAAVRLVTRSRQGRCMAVVVHRRARLWAVGSQAFGRARTGSDGLAVRGYLKNLEPGSVWRTVSSVSSSDEHSGSAAGSAPVRVKANRDGIARLHWPEVSSVQPNYRLALRARSVKTGKVIRLVFSHKES